MQSGSKNYNLRFTPYTELPDGFYDHDLVEDAKINAPRHMFLTEWCAEWIADSEGAFPMSLLEAARDERVIPKHARDQVTDKGKKFIFGIDVARERDSTAIVVVELGYPSKVVFISELEETPFPKQADHILQLIDRFNPTMIYMDEFGGGGTLRDHLQSPDTVGWPTSAKVITTDSPVTVSGRRILQLCNFNPVFIEDANNNTKTLLEQGAIKLPSATNPIEGYRKGNVKSAKKEVDLVQELIYQTASIVVTPTSTGKLHYDLPKASASGSSKPKKKDLYSAFILASKCVYDLEWKPKADRTMVECGIIKEVTSVTEARSLTKGLSSGMIIGGDSSNIQSKIIVPAGGVILSRHDRRGK